MANQAKEIIFEEEARNKLLTGIIKITDAIVCTLGPKGRNVGLEKSWGSPLIINDGNTIVKDIEFTDQYENMGASMVKEVAAKLKEKCGDGTTTTCLLLRTMAEEGVKYVSAGASPICLKRGMDKALEAILKTLEENSIAIKSDKEIISIATVSASGNHEIGQIIAEALKKVGKNGVVTIEEGKTTETEIHLVEGMRFDRGYASPYFCTDTDKMLAEMQEPLVLVVDKKITSIQELIPILQTVAALGKHLLIIADDFENEVLSTLVINRLRGSLKVTAVKAPGFGDRKKAMLEDISILTGATLITEERGFSLKDTTVQDLGSAEKILVTKENTTIIHGNGKKTAIDERIKQILTEENNASSSYDKEKAAERRAKLSGGVAVIKVGSPTESEMKQKKQIFEDSLNSTKAALDEGIVAGGGTALLRASQKILKKIKLTGDEALGLAIVAKACEYPVRQISINSGLEAAVILQQVKEASDNIGFNALSDKIEDLIHAGVIDATKVVKSCIMHAVSIAGIVLISEALIGDAPEDILV